MAPYEPFASVLEAILHAQVVVKGGWELGGKCLVVGRGLRA